MACPYFMPVAKLENGNWSHPARLPLGAGWSGHCTAPGHEGQSPAQDTLETFCNLGYAGSCSWTPPERPWDAVRFAVVAPEKSAISNRQNATESPGRVLILRYVCERSHRPVEDGILEFDLSAATWQSRHRDSRIQKMAECFLETYLRKKA
jgi:hypothetical protein